MMAGGAGAAEEVEEQTEFDVVLTAAGAKKINAIKVVRGNLPGSWGLLKGRAKAGS